MTSVVARATIVVKFGAKNGRDGVVFNEVGVLAVGIFGGQRCGRYVLGHPGGITGAAVEDGGCGESRVEVADRAGEAILKEAIGADRRSYVLQRARIGGHWR